MTKEKKSQWWDPIVEPMLCQIRPGTIAGFDQLDLTRSHPSFDLFLAGNGLTDVVELFEVDESSHAISLGETRGQALLVFGHATREVIRHAGIKHARSPRQDV